LPSYEPATEHTFRLHILKLRNKLTSLPTQITARVPGPLKSQVFSLAEAEVQQMMTERSEGGEADVTLA
jgi:hypothetical protein